MSWNLGRRPLRKRARSSAELRRLAEIGAAAAGPFPDPAGLLFDFLLIIFLVSVLFFKEGARLRVRDEGEPLVLRVAVPAVPPPKRADRLRGLLLPAPRGWRPLLDMLSVGGTHPGLCVVEIWKIENGMSLLGGTLLNPQQIGFHFRKLFVLALTMLLIKFT